MWILTSLGRPDRIRKLVESYAWGNHSTVALTLYEKDARLQEYLDQSWPHGWQIEVVPMRGNGPTYNEMLRRYPDEEQYGFLADDQILETPDMLRQMELASGDWNISYANDHHWGAHLPTMPCIGGELARAIGYLSAPGLTHWAIDTAWGEIGKKLGCLRYLEHCTYAHENPVWRTAADDKTYQHARIASFGWQDHLRSWMLGGEMDKAIQRVMLAKEKAA